MKTKIQETELYKKFKKALSVVDIMRTDDNPYIVECCKIADQHAEEKAVVDKETYAVEFAEWIKKQGYAPYKQSEDFIGWRKYINFPMQTTNQLYEKFKSQLSAQQTTDKG